MSFDTAAPTLAGSPFLGMVGMTTRAQATPGELREFHAFYAGEHVPRVVAGNPGFGTPRHFELDGYPELGTPRWLALYPVETRQHVDDYIERQSSAGPNIRVYSAYAAAPQIWNTASLVWGSLWRRAVASAPLPGEATGLLAAGVDPPPDATVAELVEFLDFYDNVHIPEILQNGGYSSYARYEKIAPLSSAVREYPRYCSIYATDVPREEADPKAALEQAGRLGRLSRGPDVWQRRTTRWRLWFTPRPDIAAGVCALG